MTAKKPRSSGGQGRKRGGALARDEKVVGTRGPSLSPRSPRSGTGAGGKRLAWGAAALLGIVCGIALWIYVLYPGGRGPGDGNAVELVVDGSDPPELLAQRLAAVGLIASPRLFAFYATLSGGTSGVVKGTHLLTDDASPGEILARLERRAAGGHARVTFPEGWTRFDMAKRLQEKHVCSLRTFLDATTDAALLKDVRIEGDSAEGYLFPATYDLPFDADGADIVRRMKAEFDKRYLTLEQRHQSGVLDLSMSLKWGGRDIVTLASIIEKEAAVDEERPIIASVFLNRLRDPEFTQPRLLQSDPTAGYGCLLQPDLASCVGYAGKITPAINNDAANAYSTYKRERLPPGPISNPGAKSIEAVMAPSTTRYFYFVAKGEGRHTFSETYGGHIAAIRDGKH